MLPHRHQICMGVVSTADPSSKVYKSLGRNDNIIQVRPGIYVVRSASMHSLRSTAAPAASMTRKIFLVAAIGVSLESLALQSTAWRGSEGHSIVFVSYDACMATMHACNALQVVAFLTCSLQHHMQHSIRVSISATLLYCWPSFQSSPPTAVTLGLSRFAFCTHARPSAARPH